MRVPFLFEQKGGFLHHQDGVQISRGSTVLQSPPSLLNESNTTNRYVLAQVCHVLDDFMLDIFWLGGMSTML